MAGITDKDQLVPGNKTVHRRPSIRGKLCPVTLGYLGKHLGQSRVTILWGRTFVSALSMSGVSRLPQNIPGQAHAKARKHLVVADAHTPAHRPPRNRGLVENAGREFNIGQVRQICIDG